MKRHFWLFGVILGSLMLLTSCDLLYPYGKDFKSIYASELQLALGDYEIGEAHKETLDADFMFESKIKRMTWRVTFKNPDGKEVMFTLANNWPFQNQIYSLSSDYLGGLILQEFKDEISSAMAFINFEYVMTLPITSSNQALFPHTITFKALPDFVVIQIFPHLETDVDALLERMKAFDQVTFYVMVDSFEGVILKKGVLQDGQYTEEALIELIDSWNPGWRDAFDQ